MMASERLQLEVVGLLSEPPFHIAKCTAEVLKHSFDAEFEVPILKPLLECAWSNYLLEKKKEIKGEAWEFSSLVMCFVDGQFIGDENTLRIWANDMWGYKDYRPLPLYKALAEDFYTKYMKGTKHVFVYIDIAIQDKPIGRLLFELFSDIYPKTCKNFQDLCTGEAGNSSSGLKLYYKGSLFHRIVKNGWIQGGDILSGKGNGGESIFGGTFEDENFALSHNKRGILGMANKGRHSNGSQFYITLQATPYMDRTLVAFGVFHGFITLTVNTADMMDFATLLPLQTAYYGRDVGSEQIIVFGHSSLHTASGCIGILALICRNRADN